MSAQWALSRSRCFKPGFDDLDFTRGEEIELVCADFKGPEVLIAVPLTFCGIFPNALVDRGVSESLKDRGAVALVGLYERCKLALRQDHTLAVKQSHVSKTCLLLKYVLRFRKTVEGSDLYSFDFGIWQDTQCCQAHHRMRIAR